MHVPPHFAQNDVAALRALIVAHPFATLAVNGADGPLLAHAPLVAETNSEGRITSLLGHVARANPFWRAVADDGGAAAVAVFSGPDAYVSPGYYPSKAEHGRVVPTWNYARVEARGTIALIEDAAGLHDIVRTLTDMMERERAAPWSVTDAPAAYVEAMLKGIVGFRMTISSLEGVFKLSQNKVAADQEGVQNGLVRDGAVDVAALMRGRKGT